jgi:hypothetical protein
MSIAARPTEALPTTPVAQRTGMAIALTAAVLVAGAVGTGLIPQTASAQGDVYRARFFLAGNATRAAVVCNNKGLAEIGFRSISSNEFKDFMHAYPKTWEKWMLEGSQNFNALVMKEGIPAACNFILKRLMDHNE